MAISSQSAINYYNFLRQKQLSITEGKPGPEFKSDLTPMPNTPTDNAQYPSN